MFIKYKKTKDKAFYIFNFQSDDEYQGFIKNLETLHDRAAKYWPEDKFPDQHFAEALEKLIGKMNFRYDDKYAKDDTAGSFLLFPDEMADFALLMYLLA